MAISITICNLALGDIRAPAIAEIGESSIEAQLCARYYPHVVSTLLDDYTYSYAVRIATLAELSSNDRSSEWLHCYALPEDCAQAMRILPTSTVSSAMATYTFPYDRMMSPNWWRDFIVASGKLYTQVDSAALEYSASTLDEVDMPPLFREAVRKLLAANLAVPLRDDRALKVELEKEAENARQAAIANDINRQPNRDAYDEVEWARR